MYIYLPLLLTVVVNNIVYYTIIIVIYFMGHRRIVLQIFTLFGSHNFQYILSTLFAKVKIPILLNILREKRFSNKRT